ncbi:MAG TPA: septal ring lytic transglycosylase RlpA family protein [Stellaceae bacterium]|nr:septal ring lytic transglycosylase RlpA family protein [Stellaceae bacterium]
MRKIVATLLLLGFLSAGWAVAQAAQSERGTATVYAAKFVGRRTADGEHLDRQHLTAAHRTLPFGTMVEITNRKNGRRAMVRINDRGPHRRHALIDLSPAAATALGINRRGSAPVELRIVKQQ